MNLQACIKNLIDSRYRLSKGTADELFFMVNSRVAVRNGRQSMELDYDSLKFQLLDIGDAVSIMLIKLITDLKEIAIMSEYYFMPSMAKDMKKIFLKRAEYWDNMLIIKYWPKRLVGDIHNFC